MVKSKTKHVKREKQKAPPVKVGDQVNVVIQNGQGQHILRPAIVTEVNEDTISASAFTKGSGDGLPALHPVSGLSYNKGEEIANTWNEK